MKLKATILTESLDSHGDKILINGVSMKNNNLPVTKDFNLSNVIGFASDFKKEKNKITCNIEIGNDYDGLTPAICFGSIDSHFEDSIFVHDKIEIVSIGLCNENADSSIKPLYKQRKL